MRPGFPISTITEDLNDITDHWPRRVGSTLFAPGDHFTPRYLETSSQLFAWLATRCHPDWGRRSDMITQEQFLEHLRATVQQYDAVEKYPHWPLLPDVYYMHPVLPATDGEYLEQFVGIIEGQGGGPLPTCPKAVVTNFSTLTRQMCEILTPDFACLPEAYMNETPSHTPDAMDRTARYLGWSTSQPVAGVYPVNGVVPDYSEWADWPLADYLLEAVI